ncbi:septum formation initiator [Natranaerovirga hydrolytica]|uniref:Septum formation initiator n=1 Tax=Natranaerovirga hydrolytica TaxID=680378 RepID=A0A4R1MCV9_9FIRM|nr:septum formation initiator family protein [Natranaerovirga hydrolytica]TCK87859.1 septum formation initiator [Natranaerovirga hydrolytica]
MKSKKKRRKSNSIKPLMVLLVMFITVIFLRISTLYSENIELERREEELNQLIQIEIEKQEEIKEQEAYIHSEEYIEKLAREKLGLIKEDEIILLPENH